MTITRIQIRGGTASEWTNANPVLAVREMGIETDTRKFKFGDGSTAWTSLAYASASGGVTDHGALTGLGDDDHTQYLRVDGTRQLTGNLAVTSGVTVDGRDIGADGATLDGHTGNTSNPHSTTAAQVGAVPVADHGKIPYVTTEVFATTPDPGSVGARVYSTVDATVLLWNGRFWEPEISESTHHIIRTVPTAGGSTIGGSGVGQSAVGTATLRNPNNTNWLSAQPRVSFAVAATAGLIGGNRDSTAIHQRGSGDRFGGFYMQERFGFALITADARWSVGMIGSISAPTNVEPSSLFNQISIAADAGDTNAQIMHADVDGPTTKVDLGSEYPAHTVGFSADVRFWTPPNGAYVRWVVMRLDALAAIRRGTITTNLPAATTFLARSGWLTNNATAAAINFDLIDAVTAMPMRWLETGPNP